MALEPLSQSQRVASLDWSTVNSPSHCAGSFSINRHRSYDTASTDTINKAYCAEGSSTTQNQHNSTSIKGRKHLTHHKLPGNAIRCLLARSLLSLQLSQEAPQYPDLKLHQAWDWAPFTGMSGHKGPCPAVMDLGPRGLAFRAVALLLLLCRALLSLQLSHQGTIVRERVKCFKGSKSKLTGSVVRLKISPRPPPLAVSHWVLKSTGCSSA